MKERFDNLENHDEFDFVEEFSVEYKFEKLEVWNLSIELLDNIYLVNEKLPELERYNLKSQMLRAATSISLNIAEGSTLSSDGEQTRYLKTSLHSLVEVIACMKIIRHRNYIANDKILTTAEEQSTRLFRMLISFIRSLQKNKS